MLSSDPNYRASRLERLLERSRRTDSGCLEFTGYILRGYGRFSFYAKARFAHRVSYELQVGPIPQGMVLDHLCRNTRCIEPTHLEAVTNTENLYRGMQFAVTECPKGHPYTEENTYVPPVDGQTRWCRKCRTCTRERARARVMTPDRPHGLLAYKGYGCRCDVCRAAGSASRREQQLRRAS